MPSGIGKHKSGWRHEGDERMSRWGDFRKKWPQSVAPGCEFHQDDVLKRELGQPGQEEVEIDLSLIRKGSQDVSQGVCGPLCCMWIFYRNIEDYDWDGGKQKPLDLVYLEKHLNSIAVSQALRQAQVGGRNEINDVFGMTPTLTRSSSVGGIYDKVTASPGYLTKVIVALNSGGSHAIALDGRGEKFIIFDPNFIRMQTTKASRARDIFKDYIAFTRYKPLFFFRYTRSA